VASPPVCPPARTTGEAIVDAGSDRPASGLVVDRDRLVGGKRDRLLGSRKSEVKEADENIPIHNISPRALFLPVPQVIRAAPD
jgi:hypothetical protein